MRFENPDGHQTQKRGRIIRFFDLTGCSSHGWAVPWFLKMLMAVDPPRGHPAKTADCSGEVTTSTAAAFIANS